ncbi:MAG: hypothetical protein ACI9W2_003314, partial [Gammaproteobacteria bacterium]
PAWGTSRQQYSTEEWPERTSANFSDPTKRR